MLLIRWKTILISPIVSRRNASEFCKLHVEYRLILKNVQTILEGILYMVLSFVFWIIVFLTWSCVKCSPEQIGYLLYIWFVTALCLLSLGATVLISMLCDLLDLDSVAVHLNRLMAKRDLVKWRTWSNRIAYYQTNAVRSIRLKYGLFACFGKDFFVDFVWVLLVRCFDVIILFHY